MRERLLRLWAFLRAGFVGRCIDKALAIAFTDRMMSLAAQAFLAMMPLLILFAVEAPESVTEGMIDALSSKLGVGGETSGDLQSLSDAEDVAGFTIIGVILVLLSATSFSRALQRMYEVSWGLPSGGLRSAWRQLAWVCGVVVYLVLLGFTFKLMHGDRVITVLRLVVTVVSAGLMWWWTPFVLLSGRVRWRALVPTSAVTTAGTFTLLLTSSWYLPRILDSNESRYGTIGVAFAVESWLVVLFAVVAAATVVGAVAGQSDNRLGAWARGGADGAGTWRRTPSRRSDRRPAAPWRGRRRTPRRRRRAAAGAGNGEAGGGGPARSRRDGTAGDRSAEDGTEEDGTGGDGTGGGGPAGDGAGGDGPAGDRPGEGPRA